MRIRTRAMQRLQCTAVLVILCAFAGVAMTEAHRCIHHELAKRRGPFPLPLSVGREVPDGKPDGWQAHSAEESHWTLIRIAVFTPDMEDPTKYCTKKDEKRPNFLGESVECSERDIFTEAKRATLTEQILPRAIQLHSIRLLVETLRVNVVVPHFLEGSVCSMFSIPEAHFKTGVSNVDMVLYAAAAPTAGATFAWALSCSQMPNGRPVSGVMNFGPHSVEDTSATIRAAAHEIAHALGFDFNTFKEKGIVSDAREVRGKSNVFMVTSSKTREKTRQHFGCPIAEGMELEDEGEGTQLEHWERRNAKDELMAGIGGLGVYSALTMAAFEDLGYYRANWGREEPMVWGRNKGCDLLTKPCVSNGKTDFPDMFCTSKPEDWTCTEDRLGLGNCDIRREEEPLPPQFQYFEDPRMRGADEDDLTDFCPFIRAIDKTSCGAGMQNLLPGSRIGPHSRCLRGNNLAVEDRGIRDICADVWCEDRDTVRVRYLGGHVWHKCPRDQTLRVTGAFSRGEIWCPRYEEVCVPQRHASCMLSMQSTPPMWTFRNPF